VPSPTLRSSCRTRIIRRGGSSASIKPRSANGLFACAAMPTSPIPSVSPTKSSCYARAPALPLKVSDLKDFPRGSPECSRRWLPIMPDAASRVKRTAEFELLGGDLVCKRPPRLSARAAATPVQGANTSDLLDKKAARSCRLDAYGHRPNPNPRAVHVTPGRAFPAFGFPSAIGTPWCRPPSAPHRSCATRIGHLFSGTGAGPDALVA